MSDKTTRQQKQQEKQKKHEKGRRLAARVSQLVHRYFIFVTKSFGFTITFAVVDILTKWWFISNLPHYRGYVMEVSSFLNFVFSWNYGISFGLFSRYSETANYLFIVIGVLLCIYLLYKQMQSITYRMFMSYSMIIGGAAGNLYHRIFYGAVFDFIDFHYKNWHYPAFNLADSFILIGIIMLIIELRNYDKYLEKIQREIAEERKKERQKPRAEES
jgi:signal peptidase II